MATIQPIKDLYLQLETAQKHMETVQEQTAKKLKDIDLQMETSQKLNDLCLQLVSVVCRRVTIVAWFLISLVVFAILLPLNNIVCAIPLVCDIYVILKLVENTNERNNIKVEITKCVAEFESEVK